MARKPTVYSVFHRMDENGVFEANPANAGARDVNGLSLYKGPVEFPKMLYHPEGKFRVVNEGIVQTDPRTNMPLRDEQGNVIRTGRIEEVINQVVETPEQEADLLAQGWHKTPAEALRKASHPGVKAPEKTPLELAMEEIAQLKALVASTTAAQVKAHKEGRA